MFGDEIGCSSLIPPYIGGKAAFLRILEATVKGSQSMYIRYHVAHSAVYTSIKLLFARHGLEEKALQEIPIKEESVLQVCDFRHAWDHKVLEKDCLQGRRGKVEGKDP